jgi:hypothetical protein
VITIKPLNTTTPSLRSQASQLAVTAHPEEPENIPVLPSTHHLLFFLNIFITPVSIYPFAYRF